GMLDWSETINPLASAVKCANVVTTVSSNYMNELKHDAMGLEQLFRSESGKCIGILNGIDTEVWDPSTDPMIENHFDGDHVAFKVKNKATLCQMCGLDSRLPTYAFIG